jgi:16S rRNA (uracil1498-N3)-methyltransferase
MGLFHRPEKGGSMTHRRFHVRKENIHGNRAFIGDAGEIRHLRRVLRLKVGDPVTLLDGEGQEYAAVLENLSPQRVSFSLPQNPVASPRESPLKLILGQGLLKSSKFEWLIQKATELGVTEIIPFTSLRVIPRLDDGQASSRQSRWEKIAAGAAKQCGRAKFPKIHPPLSFEEALAQTVEGALKIFLWEKGNRGTLGDILTKPSPVVYALVGPEGGFSEEEAARMREAGFLPVTLGPRILRAETAGLVVATLAQFFYGDLDSN